MSNKYETGIKSTFIIITIISDVDFQHVANGF